MKRLILSCLLLLPCMGQATELDPWFGPSFQIDSRLDYLYQHYRQLDTKCGDINRAADDHFVHGAISTTILGDWAVELEATMAFTERQHHDLDNFRLTGCYLILDDVVGDAVSLTVGLTYTQAFKHSLHDPSSFHHGRNEVEIHAAAGKEKSCGAFWTDRKWGLLAIGQAERGSPWGRVQLHWEKNRCDLLKGFAYAKFLFGFGTKSLCCRLDRFSEVTENLSLITDFECKKIRDFQGYGLIKHRSIDLGAGIKKRFGCYLDTGIQCSYRVFARNFPKNTIRTMVTLEYPFSL